MIHTLDMPDTALHKLDQTYLLKGVFFSFLFFSFLSFPFLSYPILSFPFLSFSFLSILLFPPAPQCLRACGDSSQICFKSCDGLMLDVGNAILRSITHYPIQHPPYKIPPYFVRGKALVVKGVVVSSQCTRQGSQNRYAAIPMLSNAPYPCFSHIDYPSGGSVFRILLTRVRCGKYWVCFLASPK